MIEKIEITQRFNFKRLNRHYECFTIDFLNNAGYYKISERGSGDKFLSESPLCDDSWIDILVDLRSRMTSEIRTFDFEKVFPEMNNRTTYLYKKAVLPRQQIDFLEAHLAVAELGGTDALDVDFAVALPQRRLDEERDSLFAELR